MRIGVIDLVRAVNVVMNLKQMHLIKLLMQHFMFRGCSAIVRLKLKSN